MDPRIAPAPIDEVEERDDRVCREIAPRANAPEQRIEFGLGHARRRGRARLQAVVEGIELARSIGRTTGNLMFDDIPRVGGKFEEQVPGRSLGDRKALEEFVRNEAWGHHASCTCPIGKDNDPMAVLDSRFRVRGREGLRVVDASVFPRIPGFFIVVPIYMMSEKATDVLLEDIGEERR